MITLKNISRQIEPSEEPTLDSRHPSGWFVFLMLSGISGYLYLNLFLLTNVPILLSDDQVYFWVNGQRMLYGERPYADFFQFTPPGTDVLYFVVFKLFGTQIWALNCVVLVTGVFLCWVCFVIAGQIMERHLALLSALVYLTLIYTRLLNTTHHYFSVLTVMGATAILMREVSFRSLAIAGALLGVGSFFTQTHGASALLGFTLLLGWERYRNSESWRSFWRKETILLLSFVIALLTLSGPFIASVGLKQLWDFQVMYVGKVMVHKPETHLLGMPTYPNWQALPLLFVGGEYSRHFFVYGLLPTIYLIVLLRCRKKLLPPSSFRKVALLALVGSCLLGELIFGLNWLRLYAVSMAGVILLVWVISTSTRIRGYGLKLAWVLVIILGVSQIWSTQHRDLITMRLPAGRSAVGPKEFEKLKWGMDHTRPGEYFFQAPWPGMYIPLGLRNPVFLDTAGTMFSPQWVERAIQQLEAKQVNYIVWAPRLDYPVDPRNPRTANIIPLRTYVHTRYRLSEVFQDGDEVWERR
jgi:Dolichyl-phosphate-mannose-protein mannosyltransferase